MEGQHLFETLRRLFNLKNIYRMENVGTPLEAFDLEKGPTVKSRDLWIDFRMKKSKLEISTIFNFIFGGRTWISADVLAKHTNMEKGFL